MLDQLPTTSAGKATRFMETQDRHASPLVSGMDRYRSARVSTGVNMESDRIIIICKLIFPHAEIVRCPDLEDPPYGSVNQTGNKPGSTAHYDCDYSFQLVGDEYRECLYTGYWNGSEPICKSMHKN